MKHQWNCRFQDDQPRKHRQHYTASIRSAKRTRDPTIVVLGKPTHLLNSNAYRLLIKNPQEHHADHACLCSGENRRTSNEKTSLKPRNHCSISKTFIISLPPYTDSPDQQPRMDNPNVPKRPQDLGLLPTGSTPNTPIINTPTSDTMPTDNQTSEYQPARLSTSIQSALGSAAVPYIVSSPIPDPASRPQNQFDGKNVTEWLRGVERLFKSCRLPQAEWVDQLPYWTKTIIEKHTVQHIIGSCTDWDQTVTSLKQEYKTTDPKQTQSQKEQLTKLLLSTKTTPQDYAQFFLRHAALVNKLSQEIPSIPKKSYLHDLVESIPLDHLRSILNKHRITKDDLRQKEYTDAIDIFKQ